MYYLPQRIATLFIFLCLTFSAHAGFRIKIDKVAPNLDGGYEITYSLVDDSKSLSYTLTSPLHASHDLTEIDPSEIVTDSSGDKEEALKWIESIKKWMGKCQVSFPDEDKPYYILINKPELNIINQKYDLPKSIVNQHNISISPFIKHCEVDFDHELLGQNDKSLIKAKIFVRDNLDSEDIIMSPSFVLNHEAKINSRFSSLIPNQNTEDKNINKYRISYYEKNTIMAAESELVDYTCPSIPGIKKLASPKYIGLVGKSSVLPYEKALPCKLTYKNDDQESDIEDKDFMTLNPVECEHQYFYTENNKVFIPQVYEGEACTYIPPFSTESRSIKSYRITIVDNSHQEGKRIPLSSKSNYSFASKNLSKLAEFNRGLFELNGDMSFDTVHSDFFKNKEKLFVFKKKDFKYPIFETDQDVISIQENLDSFKYSKLINSITLDWSKIKNESQKQQFLNTLETKEGIKRVHIENFDILDTYAERILESISHLKDTLELIISTKKVNSVDEFIIFKIDLNGTILTSKNLSEEKSKKENEIKSQKQVEERKRQEEEKRQNEEKLKKEKAIKDKELEFYKLKQDLVTTRENLSEKDKHIERLNLENKDLCSKVENTEQCLVEANSTIERAKRKVLSQNDLISQNKLQIEELNVKFQNSEKSRDNYVERLEEEKYRNQDAQGKINELSKQCQNLNCLLEKERINLAQSQKAGEKNNVKNLKIINELEEQNRVLSQELENKNKGFKALKSKIENTERDLMSEKSSSLEKDRKIKTLNRRLTDATNELSDELSEYKSEQMISDIKKATERHEVISNDFSYEVKEKVLYYIQKKIESNVRELNQYYLTDEDMAEIREDVEERFNCHVKIDVHVKIKWKISK